MAHEELLQTKILKELNKRCEILQQRMQAGRQRDVIDVAYNMLRINRKPYRCGKYTRELISFVKNHFEYWQSVYENGNECALYYLGDRTFALSYEPQEVRNE